MHSNYPYNLDSNNLEHSYTSASRHYYSHCPIIHYPLLNRSPVPSCIVTTRSTGTTSLTATHCPQTKIPYQPPVPPDQGVMSYPLSMLTGQPTTSYPPSMPPDPGTMSYLPPMQPGRPTTSYSPPILPDQGALSYPPPMRPDQGTMSYPPPMPPDQGTMSYPPPMPPDQGTMSYPPPMQPGQSNTSYPPPMSPDRGELSYPPPMQPGQSNTSYPPPMPPDQGIMSYPPPMRPGQPTTSYPPPMQPGQSTTSYSPPMPPAQGAMSYPLSMLPGQPGQMATLQSPPVPAQAAMSYLPRMQPDQAAMPQVPQILPTPFTTPLAYPQTAPQLNRRLAVWCVRIPGDGTPIHRIRVEIVIDQLHKPQCVPVLKHFWTEKDPTAQLMHPTLHAQFDPPPLGGYYLLFTRIDATHIPRNQYMGHRICGDALLLKINELRCLAEPIDEEAKFDHAVYEDVPEDMLTSRLLEEIMRPMEWKVLPHGNVVRLGFERWRMWAEFRERRERVQREKNVREEMAKRKREDMGIDTREYEERQERWSREWSQRQRILREDREREEREREEREEREREREERERERQERERQEREREERERKERMADERASAGEVLVGLPYQLRPGMATTPDSSIEERHASTSTTRSAPHDSLVPSIEEQRASTSTNQDGTLTTEQIRAMKNIIEKICAYREPDGYNPSKLFRRKVSKRSMPDYYNVIKEPVALDTLKAKILKKEYKSFSEFVRDCALISHNAQTYNRTQTRAYQDAIVLRREFEKEFKALDDQGFISQEVATYPDLGELPPDIPGSSVEEHHAFTSINKPVLYNLLKSSSGERPRFTGIYGPELYDSPEQLSGEQNESTPSRTSDQQESHDSSDRTFSP